MTPGVGIGERYATQVGVLWTGLARTLAKLDEIAQERPAFESDETIEILRHLQYRLHIASERAYGLAPPAGIEPAHAELGSALAAARDATAELIEAVETVGPEAGDLHLYEWRGALFRVRLARLRLVAEPAPAEPAPADDLPSRDWRAPLAGLALAAGGAVAFAVGAVAGDWAIWSAGIVALCCSFLVYRP